MPLHIYHKHYIPEEIANIKGYFVFGDNCMRVGKAGQAVIRDLPNAFGIPTKYAPSSNFAAFFRDNDSVAWEIIDEHLIDLERLLIEGHDVWFPSKGIGTGLAGWQELAPKLLKHVERAVANMHRDYQKGL
jgi:hypothetical protein